MASDRQIDDVLRLAGLNPQSTELAVRRAISDALDRGQDPRSVATEVATDPSAFVSGIDPVVFRGTERDPGRPLLDTRGEGGPFAGVTGPIRGPGGESDGVVRRGDAGYDPTDPASVLARAEQLGIINAEILPSGFVQGLFDGELVTFDILDGQFVEVDPTTGRPRGSGGGGGGAARAMQTHITPQGELVLINPYTGAVTRTGEMIGENTLRANAIQLELDRAAQRNQDIQTLDDILTSPRSFATAAAVSRGVPFQGLNPVDLLGGGGPFGGGALTTSAAGPGRNVASAADIRAGLEAAPDGRFRIEPATTAAGPFTGSASGLQQQIDYLALGGAPESVLSNLRSRLPGTAAGPFGGLDPAALSREAAPPAVRDFIEGRNIRPVTPSIPLPTREAFEGLTSSEREALGTALELEGETSLEHLELARRQREAPNRRARTGRIVG